MFATFARFTVIGLFSLCATAPMASAEIYHWVDSTGDTHFVGNLDEVPDEYRDAAIANSKAAPEGGAVDIIPGIDKLQPAAMAAPSPTRDRSQNQGAAPSQEPIAQSQPVENGETDAIDEDAVEDDGEYDEGYYGAGDGVRGEEARERAHQRQLHRDANGTRQMVEGAEQVRERPPEMEGGERMQERSGGRR
jgi:hypothetical protein